MLLKFREDIFVQSSESTGLYMIVVRNCSLLVLYGRLDLWGNIHTFFLYLVVALVAITPFLMLLVAK